MTEHRKLSLTFPRFSIVIGNLTSLPERPVWSVAGAVASIAWTAFTFTRRTTSSYAAPPVEGSTEKVKSTSSVARALIGTSTVTTTSLLFSEPCFEPTLTVVASSRTVHPVGALDVETRRLSGPFPSLVTVIVAEPLLPGSMFGSRDCDKEMLAP